MLHVNLDESARYELNHRAHQVGISPHIRDRIEMVRLSHAGWTIAQISEHLLIGEQRVKFWINSYIEGGIEALSDKPRSGRPPIASPELLTALESLLTDEAAGDPMNEKKWVRNS